ncbi:hypothetical protein Tco_0790692 [Tanacetum coccineum]
MITKRGRRLQRYDLQLIMCGDIVKDSNSYLKSRGSIEDFVSFREMITSQLQGKLWLYDEVTKKISWDYLGMNLNNFCIDLESVVGSQILTEQKGFLVLMAVSSPHPLILNRPTTLDLSYSGLEEFKEPEMTSLEQHQWTDPQIRALLELHLWLIKIGNEKFILSANQCSVCKIEKPVRKNNDAPIIEDWVSDDEDEVETTVVVKKKTVIPTAAKIEKPVRKPVRYAEMYRSQRPRGNQRNWNGQKSNQLGCNFVFNNKACFICGSFDHIQYSCPNQQRKRIVSGNNYNKKDNDYYSKTSHSSAHKHMAPRAVLMKTGLKSVNTARPVNTVRSVNTGRPFSTARSFNTVRPSYTAHPKSTIHCARPRTYFQNQAQSTVHRPFSKRTAFTKRCFNQKFDTGRPFRSTVNTVKASACWVWMRHKKAVVDHVSKNISASVTLKRWDYIDAQGRFKSVMAWMDAQIQGRQECSKEKEESRERGADKAKAREDEVLEESTQQRNDVLNQSVNTVRITAVSEKVNAAESLLVVSMKLMLNLGPWKLMLISKQKD